MSGLDDIRSDKHGSQRDFWKLLDDSASTHENDAATIRSEASDLQRVVNLQFFVWKVTKISTIEQSFDCRLNVRASFLEDASEIKFDDNVRQWTRDAFTWTPQLRFSNLLQDIHEREEWWRVAIGEEEDSLQWLSPADSAKVAGSNTRVWVHQNLRVTGTFEELFELRHFPLDLQQLHVTITSSWDTKQCALRFSDVQRSTVSSRASVSQLFRMHAPRMIDYDSDWRADKDLPLLSNAVESRTGARYCRAHIALVMTRQHNYYVWNILTMQMLIVIANFSVFAIDPESIADRLGLIITLILASAAFKFVTTSMLPETPYITIIDEFSYFVLLQQAAFLAAIVLMSRAGWNTYAEDDALAVTMLATFGAFIIFYIVRFAWLLHTRAAKVKEAEATFAARYEHGNVPSA